MLLDFNILIKMSQQAKRQRPVVEDKIKSHFSNDRHSTTAPAQNMDGLGWVSFFSSGVCKDT